MGVFDDFGAILPNGKMAKVAKSPTDFLCLDFRMREAIYRMSAWPRLQIRVSANSAKPPHGGNNENDEKKGILGDVTNFRQLGGLAELAETDISDSSFNRIVRLSNYALYGS